MPTDPSEAEFRQGEPGVDEQMGQGETQELNDGLDLADDLSEENEGVGESGVEGSAEPDDSMQPATLADFEPQGGAQGEDMAFVTGPTLKPDEAQWVGSRSASGPVSSRVRRRLPTLQKAAQAPGASPRLQAMVKWLVENAN